LVRASAYEACIDTGVVTAAVLYEWDQKLEAERGEVIVFRSRCEGVVQAENTLTVTPRWARLHRRLASPRFLGKNYS
jgi:hypothetical protein